VKPSSPKKPPQNVQEYELMRAIEREVYPTLRKVERDRDYPTLFRKGEVA
jgi:hypothetical protein